MNKSWILAGFLTLGSLEISIAQETKQEEREELDEIVIDSRFKIKKENSGKIVHKITPAVIEQNKAKTVVDLINRVSGIEINGNTSVFGQNLGYFVRGGRSNEVLIMIDGVAVVNPLQNSFDLRFIDLDQVESIEISKGASSILYGSGAATAVIDIRMKKASEGAFNGIIETFLGTNQTVDSDDTGSIYQANIGINGRERKFNYLANFSSFTSQGISAAIDESGNNAFEDDPFQRNNLDVLMGYDFSDKFVLNGAFSANNFDNSFDSDSFTEGDNETNDKNYRISLSPEYRYDKGTVNVNFAYTKFNVDRVQTSFPGKSDGDNYMVDAFVRHNFGNVKLIGGVNFQSNKIRTFSIPFGGSELKETQFVQEPKTTITDPYVNVVYISDIGFNVNTGVRMNNHNIYGNNFVYNFNPSYRFGNENGYTRIFGSYSTAFVVPSIQDLFSSFGNLDLNPQESTTLEFGAEFKKDSFTISATYFNRDVTNLIVFDPVSFILINSGDTKINGVEVNTSYNFTNSFGVKANYTYTNNEDAAIRIPKSKANLGLSYRLSDKTNFSLDYQYVNDRDDTDFRDFLNVQNVALDAYSLLDFGATRELLKGLNIYANITNILNSDYQEIFGFSTRGRNFKLGFGYQF